MCAMAASAAIALSVAGCGQRGPLVLPVKSSAAQTKSQLPSPVASSPGATKLP